MSQRASHDRNPRRNPWAPAREEARGATRGDEENTASSRRWLALGVVCVALAVISIDETVVNVALPTLSWELSTSATQLQWIVESYVLVIGTLVLTLGTLSDRYGRRLGLVLGLVVFGAASAAGAFAPSADLLIAARAAMGIGAAMI